MYGWLNFHFVYLFISMVFTLVVFVVYYQIDSKLRVKSSGKKAESAKVEEADAIN